MTTQLELLQESLANLKRARERDAARIKDLEAALEDIVELEDDGDKSYRWGAAVARARALLKGGS